MQTMTNHLTASDAVAALLRLQGLEADAERQANRPGRKRTPTERQADFDAHTAARERTQTFIESLLPGRGQRLASEVDADADRILEWLS